MADMIRRSRTGAPSVQRERGNNWTASRRAAFLGQLAATCNVTKACEAVGMHPCGAYRLRLRDSVFAGQWHDALLTGYDRLEAALLRRAMDAVELPQGDAIDGPIDGPIDVRTAIDLLKMHHARQNASQNGRPRAATGPAVRRASEAETDAAILKQLAIIDKRLKADRA